MLKRRQFLKMSSVVVASSLFAFPAAATTTTALFQKNRYRVLALVFDDYETLDLHGPIEMLGHMPNVEIKLVGPTELVRSYQGPRVVADALIDSTYDCDLLLIPGGLGTRKLVDDEPMLQWLTAQFACSKKVFSVCTGSALLAKTSSLDGVKATTNKMAFKWVTSLGDKVHWQPKARWVDDGKFLTSSGVSAGTDAALYWVKQLHGEAEARRIETLTEYHWVDDSENDPYGVTL
ncbi:DJ-1/PfpI family protein [Shewanella gelidimarina]|uniref:DJ-1/PfpI family protein n=1 Tax=Shewanella gelidimarina TaxID=56813 RepID=UPI00200EB22F|nr:DJ-1/PfpI family protein [Shewanella gelidimarina]MCL1056471.1 DJ-1/PfpI family protein [Shewanella gelidimarina]